MRAFGESGQWAELTALAKTKKSPIGFAPFLDVCLKQVRLMNPTPQINTTFQGERAQAAKYLSLLGQEDRLRFVLQFL